MQTLCSPLIFSQPAWVYPSSPPPPHPPTSSPHIDPLNATAADDFIGRFLIITISLVGRHGCTSLMHPNSHRKRGDNVVWWWWWLWWWGLFNEGRHLHTGLLPHSHSHHTLIYKNKSH
ncbi:unnamed protein product [Arctogadus glacialis]